jgi:ABC-type lipoprotein export system ATPase subunit
LADEPTGNLDPENGDRVLRSLAQFAEGGGGVLLVTHDPRAAEHARRILSMDHGRIDGPAGLPARPAELHET